MRWRYTFPQLDPHTHSYLREIVRSCQRKLRAAKKENTSEEKPISLFKKLGKLCFVNQCIDRNPCEFFMPATRSLSSVNLQGGSWQDLLEGLKKFFGWWDFERKRKRRARAIKEMCTGYILIPPSFQGVCLCYGSMWAVSYPTMWGGLMQINTTGKTRAICVCHWRAFPVSRE